jgi:hypothetical protein
MDLLRNRLRVISTRRATIRHLLPAVQFTIFANRAPDFEVFSSPGPRYWAVREAFSARDQRFNEPSTEMPVPVKYGVFTQVDSTARDCSRELRLKADTGRIRRVDMRAMAGRNS